MHVIFLTASNSLRKKTLNTLNQKVLAMIIAYLLILAFILGIAFYAGRYLFWLLFMKDAPSMEELDGHFGYSKRL